MQAMFIVNQAVEAITEDLSLGEMVSAVSHWQTISEALGKCSSKCNEVAEPSTEKCAECLVAKLISDSNARHRSEQEGQRYIKLARELKVWIDWGA